MTEEKPESDDKKSEEIKQSTRKKLVKVKKLKNTNEMTQPVGGAAIAHNPIALTQVCQTKGI